MTDAPYSDKVNEEVIQGGKKELNKKEKAEKYGSDKVKAWRRSFDIPTPALEENDERNQANQKIYRDENIQDLPLHESLKDTIAWVVPFYSEIIFPTMKSGERVLVSAHESSLRTLVKYLDNISAQEINELNIPSFSLWIRPKFEAH